MPKLCLSRPGGTTFATSCRACCRCLASRAKLLTYWNEFHLSRLWITFEFPQREGVTQVTSSMKLYGVTWVSWEEITESLLQEGGFDISVSKLRENSSLNQCWRCLMEREAGLMQVIWKSGPWCRWRIPSGVRSKQDSCWEQQRICPHPSRGQRGPGRANYSDPHALSPISNTCQELFQLR